MGWWVGGALEGHLLELCSPPAPGFKLLALLSPNPVLSQVVAKPWQTPPVTHVPTVGPGQDLTWVVPAQLVS